MADQLAAAALGCYGSGIASTPALDALAADGLRFDRCYASVPVCAPSRATFLTGRSPVVHGVVSNNYALTTATPTYAHVLQRAGYRTGGFGKFHQTPMHCAAPGSLDYLGFEESVVTEDPKWPWYEWVCRTHPAHAERALAMSWAQWPSHPPHAMAEHVAEARRRHLQPRIERSGWQLMYASPLPPEVHDTAWITEMGLDFIERHQARRGDQPFCCHISYVDPHDPYNPPEPYASMFRPEEMPAPRPAAWIAEGISRLHESQRFVGFDRIWRDKDAIARLRALYHGSLRFLDDQIRRIVARLDDLGLRDNTLVLFTTDHGEMLGDHGLITKGVKHYDMGVRCPLIASGPGVHRAAATSRLTSTLDFFPTFCDLAGVPLDERPPLEGASFAGALESPEAESGFDAVSVAFDGVVSVISDDGWRLTRYLDDHKTQLFNLREDANEQHNLAGEARHADRLRLMLEKLVEVNARPARVPHYANMPLIDGRKRPVVMDCLQEGLAPLNLPAAPGV
jgi:arylsulfatase A-like enzyme